MENFEKLEQERLEKFHGLINTAYLELKVIEEKIDFLQNFMKINFEHQGGSLYNPEYNDCAFCILFLIFTTKLEKIEEELLDFKSNLMKKATTFLGCP